MLTISAEDRLTSTSRFAMRWLSLLLLVLILPLAACATTPRGGLTQIEGPYRLDTGDVVRVTIYGDTELSKSYRVDDSGSIAFPLVGPVVVRGQTTAAAADRIAAKLADGFLRNPDVAVEVETYRPFFIQGEVRNSGQFAYVYGMTVRNAIATAGGFTETADRGRALVYRRENGEQVRSTVTLDFPIVPGDTIVVQERWF
jgi:polysaccharide biosynthesis/export protein